MPKRVSSIILLVIFLLAACKGSDQPTSVESATAEKLITATSAPTRITVSLPTVAATQTIEPTVAPTEDTKPGPGCTLISYLPDDPSESLYPEVTEKDWVQGSDTAQVTIIEYSDFQ
jgi:hypothetical protein